MKEFIKEGIKRAMMLPGMDKHINRKKSYWKNLKPSNKILESWLRFRVIEMISRKLNNENLIDLIELYDMLEIKYPD